MLNQTIIIIDSDPLLLDVLAIALNREGYKVIVTTEHRSVLKLVKQHQPNMVIIEFRLRRNEAWLLCQQLSKYNNNLILLALSSNSDIKNIYASRGFDGFVPKPFELDELFDTVNSFIGRYS